MNSPTVYTSLAGCPINLVGKTGQAVQISIHSPSQYICANRERILPDWKKQLSFWVVIVLQQSRYPLIESTPEIEAEKERLREKFMRFGFDVAFNLRDGVLHPPYSGRGYVTDLIDPRTGYPLLSRPGNIPHDDTAVVKALLSYPVIKNKCRVLIHPHWGMAVYPSILISAAPPIVIESVLKSIAPLHGWKETQSQLSISNEPLLFSCRRRTRVRDAARLRSIPKGTGSPTASGGNHATLLSLRRRYAFPTGCSANA